jgi:hypothetical protein
MTWLVVRAPLMVIGLLTLLFSLSAFPKQIPRNNRYS